ncbi:MAG: SDR family oxidoreductase [Myxococcales bacterium]|nr:SDR family oxidoreductase [Deltaproteobacteria bacterium]NND29179.1 SDR family oxidoreductase [Myxococcales bacterium]MBT8482478.1 SDR family oxidoreductase [Deltaproteobacteria bacterium]NNK41976.1 SDR family oxidoreductase [Myxococcales bacterium]NNL25342.1 SDR family oxidoreductase [Myxococcales bacterium]
MAKDLAGKVAIITGGAGGIGKALAEELAARGCYLVLADINAELLETTAAELRAGEAQVDARAVDVRDAAQVHALVEGAHRELGRIDYIFNNAAVNVCAELRDTSLEDWNRLIDVNLRGVVHGVHAAYPIMRAQGSGHIVNTASAAGLIPAAAEGAYAATKHAVVGLSSTLRIEAASFGVRVSVVCPGLVDTPILDSTKYVKLRSDALRKISPGKPAPPRTAARQILRGVDRNRLYIVLTPTVNALWRLHRYAPGASLGVGRIAVRLFRRERTEDD